MAHIPRSAAIYVRISLDREEEAGVTRQKQDCTKLAERLKWGVGQVYEDNSVSAYSKQTKRPEWQALLDDLNSGVRDGLIAYDLDRVARQPRDLEDLIDAVEARKLPTAVVTGDIDLGTDNGVFVARLMVNVGNKSSRDTGRRVARAAQQRAEQGRPHKSATRPFGYTADYKIIEHEAEIIRSAYNRVIAGESLASILKEWKQLPTVVPGKSWHRQTLKKILQAPRNAGLNIYRGEIIGKGNWEPIVDRATWDATQAIFDARTSPMPDTTTVYLLSKIARCGKCGSPMYGRKANKTRKDSYTCMSGMGGCGGINRQMLPVDQYIEGLIKAHIAKGKPAVIEIREDNSEIEKSEKRIRELRQAWTDGLIEMSDFIPMRDAETKKLQDLRKEKAEINQTKIISETFADNFDEANLSQKRALIKRYIEAVVIKPAIPGSRTVDYDAIEVIWKTSGS
jgi:site-specific DNA recombinase